MFLCCVAASPGSADGAARSVGGQAARAAHPRAPAAPHRRGVVRQVHPQHPPARRPAQHLRGQDREVMCVHGQDREVTCVHGQDREVMCDYSSTFAGKIGVRDGGRCYLHNRKIVVSNVCLGTR